MNQQKSVKTWLGTALGLCALIALPVGASRFNAQPAPAVHAQPTAQHQSLARGSRTIFILTLDRNLSVQGIRDLWVQGLPKHAQAQITPQGTGAVLTVWTTPQTPAGTHRLTVAMMGQAEPVTQVAITTTSAPLSMAYGLWTPTKWDTCTKTIHDSYSVVGPDGKLYPTWHPTVDTATGCTFGHEHGRDPKLSDLYSFSGGMPFGVANEAQMANDASSMRHEDHVGHKVEWDKGIRLTRKTSSGNVYTGVSCDFLVHVHQGSHSPDAFGSNLHEISYFVQCSDGRKLGVTKLEAFGDPSIMTRGCDRTKLIQGPPAEPEDSPDGDHTRRIPDSYCVKEFFWVPTGEISSYYLGFQEIWSGENFIVKPNGTPLAFFDPYFLVRDPSRYYDPGKSNNLSRSMDACYFVEANGDSAHTGSCAAVTDKFKITDITWDDPRSAFKGVQRQIFFNRTIVTNLGGVTTWYTDPFGKNAQTTPFTGSIKQYISATDNGEEVSEGVRIFRDYQDPTVHAPN
ncbi:hypothetical protein [Candidatus Cyanaurora vandensis]|uniref:hypothetical protein n=1 Tax=Candidatus Cyanaurora vandensis TaxID=2714958 RepID=UPI00257B4286|nr:hypothetical protein [Candidatus Cyanaurora vandensis]